MDNRLLILSFVAAIAVGLWFGFNALNPRPFKGAEYDRCVGRVIETSNASGEVASVCQPLK